MRPYAASSALSVKTIRANGGGTNLNTVFPVLDKPYDRIIILSDTQNWVAGAVPQKEFTAYCQKFNCRPNIFSFDLTGDGTLQFPERQVYAIAGFSERVFDLMSTLESDRGALVHAVESVELA